MLQTKILPAAPSSVRDHCVRRIGPVAMEVLDKPAAIRRILSDLQDASPSIFAFCNMHTFNLAYRSEDYARVLSMMTVFNDGIGIDIASRLLCGQPFPDNLNGTDLTPALLESLAPCTRVFLVGSPPGVAETASLKLQQQFPHIQIVGTHHGFFSEIDGDKLADTIRLSHADLVLAGMGNPRQEFWALEILGRTGAVILCVGAFLDFAAGVVPRAPLLLRKLNSEWVYRLALEPRRMTKRYLLGIPLFLFRIMRERRLQRQKRNLAD